MSETTTKDRPAKAAGELSAMLLPELKKVAGQLGIEGATKMSKADLIQSIADLQAANREAAKAEREARRLERQEARNKKNKNAKGAAKSSDESEEEVSEESDAPEQESNSGSESSESQRRDFNDRNGGNDRGNRNDRNDRGGRRDRNDRNRFRDRGERGERQEREIQLSEDDVLVPVGGLLDILDSYAFIRTQGYLAGPNDVYVSLQQIRRYGLRKGDVITGQVRQPREGERKEKFNALVRLDTVNGLEPEAARDRVDFAKLVPLYPQERLRLETEPNILTTRVIDLVAPIGKGQRGLIVSPPKAGKTMVLQAIANAITTNNPEVHLMVVLVDERPEEVTDMQRSVKGEVIASTLSLIHI